MESSPRGPVVQELDLTLDNPTDRVLFQLGTLPSAVRPAILPHGLCRPKGPFAIGSENGNSHAHFLGDTDREPRTVIHVKRAKMFDPIG